MRRIGIDVGGVIMTNANQTEDTSFFGGNYLKSQPNEGAFESIAELVSTYGAENIFIVSKCGSNTQRKTLEWFAHNDFYRKTGFLESNVYFCKRRHEKAPICEKLGITDFIDDRLEVLSYMKSVKRLFLFEPSLNEVESWRGRCNNYTPVWGWADLMNAFRG